MDFVASYWPAVRSFLDTGAGTLASVVVGAAIIGYSIIRGLQATRLVEEVSSIGRGSLPTGPSLPPAEQKAPLFVPRREVEYPSPVRSGEELFEAAAAHHTAIFHVLTHLTEDTRPHAMKLFAMVRNVIARKEGTGKPIMKDDRANLCDWMRRELVTLKGNDVWVYALQHIKWMPESDELQVGPRGDGKPELYLAFGPPSPPPGDDREGKVGILVDNGHPRMVRWDLPFEANTTNPPAETPPSQEPPA